MLLRSRRTRAALGLTLATCGDVHPAVAQAARYSTAANAAIAQPSCLADPAALLDWEGLGSVLRSSDEADVLVVAQGHLLPLAPPRCLADLRAYMAAGVGLCVRRAERHHERLAAIAAAFSTRGRAHVQLFVTPARSYGFGWHYDDEDVFVFQLDGEKDYYFRANTVADHLPACPATFGRFAAERSPLHTTHLIAGDFLHLPSRWWHMAKCQADALSISVGVTRR